MESIWKLVLGGAVAAMGINLGILMTLAEMKQDAVVPAMGMIVGGPLFVGLGLALIVGTIVEELKAGDNEEVEPESAGHNG